MVWRDQEESRCWTDSRVRVRAQGARTYKIMS